MKKVLVACEESQTVCKAFRKLGFEAYSCDIQDCSGGHPEWHIKGDVLEQLDKGWDLIIAHPPCTYISRAGARWMYKSAGVLCEERYRQAMDAKDFFMKLLNSNAKFVAVENPLPLKIVALPKETQVIQPYEYGHEYSKRTHLWLKGLPKLIPTDIKENYSPYLPSNTGGKKRGQSFNKGVSKNAKESSKTFQGIADAMAQQWGEFLLKQ